MGFDLNVSVSAVTVFVQGILSFLSPCVLPILPMYMAYLSGGAVVGEDGQKQYNQKIVLKNTVFFILGVSFAFFLLGLGFSALGTFFTQYQTAFTTVGGILIILLGLMQLGFFRKPFGEGEWRLPISLQNLQMNGWTALLMGFVFSFAWTPCVGPALSTVLIMVSSATTMTTGLLLMGIYTLGFVIPFLLVGIFTTQCLNFFQKNRAIVSYTVKIGGVLMIIMGVLMVTGLMNTLAGYLSTTTATTEPEVVTEEVVEELPEEVFVEEPEEIPEEIPEEPAEEQPEEPEEELDKSPALAFELTDQFGNVHTMEDYKGKVVFLNFWATWCSPCKMEMPDIQALYEAYGENQGDVIILGVVSPKSAENSNTQEQDEAGVIAFLAENQYTYPTVMDNSGQLSWDYGIRAYPTTFMIDADGNVYGYLSGMMTYDIMEEIIAQTQGMTME